MMESDSNYLMDDVPLNNNETESTQQYHQPSDRRSMQWRIHLGLLLTTDIIGDDLDAQIEQQRQHYQQTLCVGYPYPVVTALDKGATDKDEERVTAATTAAAPEVMTSPTATAVSSAVHGISSSLDPLSAILQEEDEKLIRQQEIDKQYRKERALRKRGVATERKFEEEPDDAAAWIQLIAKDLHRLPHPHTNNHNANNTIDDRIRILQRVLFRFACIHPAAGYLQGMHEIASYVLYALELEHDGRTIIGTDAITVQDRLEADTYVITERILTMLFAAYDVVVADTSTTDTTNAAAPAPASTKPLLQMSNRIVAQTGTLWPALHQHLTAAFRHIPSQLIFTKWIRLLFSRELDVAGTGGSLSAVVETTPLVCLPDLILKLWDALFEAAYKVSQKQQSSPGVVTTSSLQLTAEAFCVARLWQHGNTILHLSGHPDLLLHWFMNVPPEPAADVASLIQRMRVVLQLEGLSAATLPPPLPVSTEITALTATSRAALPPPVQQQVYPSSSSAATPSQQQQQYSIWDNPGPLLAAAHPRLTSLTEKLAAKTHSIQQRIAQEWENMQLQLEHQHPEVAAAVRQAPGLKQSPQQASKGGMYNLDYYTDDPLRQYSNINNDERTADGQRPQYTNSTSLSGQRPQQQPAWSDQLQSHWTVLQQFAVTVGQQPGPTVPPQVWEALADLQVLQQEMRKNGL
jgi:Rab-GTPase-TBC domain